jgi:hypothetical protein
VLGVALGGIFTARFGWRWSFGVMALLGLALTVLHRLVVSDGKVARYGSPLPVDGAPEPVDVPRVAAGPLPQSAPRLRLSGQRPAAVRGRSAHHLAADLSDARLRLADGEGRTRGRGRHPGHEPRDGGLRVGHRPAEPVPAGPAVDDLRRLLPRLPRLPRDRVRRGTGKRAAGAPRPRWVLRRRPGRCRGCPGHEPDPRSRSARRRSARWPWRTTCSAWPPGPSWWGCWPTGWAWSARCASCRSCRSRSWSSCWWAGTSTRALLDPSPWLDGSEPAESCRTVRRG